MTNTWLLVIFVVIWAVTFIPAWKMLLNLVAYSASDRPINFQFVFNFTLYRLIILLPYLILLVFGRNLPDLLKNFVIGLVALAFVLSFVRFFLRNYLVAFLWNIYSYVYDGLLRFYPYTHLLDLVEDRIQPKDGQVILDAGGGTGNLSRKLAKTCPAVDIVYIDASSKMVKGASKKLKGFDNITLKQAEVLDYLQQQPQQKFDVIALVNVLYALGDRKQFWPAALEHLSEGGRLIVTNSDRGGSWPIIKEHLKHGKLLTLLHPKLIGVFVVDLFIGQLASVGKFSFISEEMLQKEIARAGGIMHDVKRCYGGEQEGVNLLFTVTVKR